MDRRPKEQKRASVNQGRAKLGRKRNRTESDDEEDLSD